MMGYIKHTKDLTMHRLIKLPLFIVSFLSTSVLADVPLTTNQLHATLGIITNFILDDGTVQFHGKTYKPVTSPHTGRVWLDRNIGASKKCISYDHALCYGDLFQWGRKHDGHESSVDSTTVLASNINNAGAEYIRGATDWASTDSSYGNGRATNWLKTDGSSVCPVGYRVPLRSELDAEVGDISNKETAYANFLKFPAAGYRSYVNGNYILVGAFGAVWSVSSSKSRASYFRFYSVSDWNDSGERGYGLSVRCIKHVGKPLIYHNTTVYSTVTSPYTGRVWLDRNLGASQVCTTFNDAACYGDYYQWGRGFDGHQDSGSATTATLATNVNSAGSSFITSGSSPFDWTTVDSDGSLRLVKWLQTDGSSVCPAGFLVPNVAELKAETLDNGVTNRATAFSNFLKLPSAGERTRFSGSMNAVGSWGSMWYSTVTYGDSTSRSFHFDSNLAYTFGYGSRASGLSVRCMKDY